MNDVNPAWGQQRPSERWMTDKIINGYHLTYVDLAREMFSQARFSPSILEIGAADGAGMIYLRDIFGALNIVGVEIEEHRVAQCRALGFPCVHTTQTDPNLPALVGEPHPGTKHGDDPWPGWDLIVDDASHDTVLTGQTLDLMWPTLGPRGVYVIEDWNLFDLDQTRDMWANLYQRVLPWLRGSGAVNHLDRVTIRHGMIILHKGGWDQ